MTHPFRATIDRTRERLTGEDGRFLYAVPLVGTLTAGQADALFHAVRDEATFVQNTAALPALERVTLRVRDGEVQVIIHAPQAAVAAWTQPSCSFADALERALDGVQASPAPGGHGDGP